MSPTTLIEEQAALWRVRRDRAEWSEQDQQALDAWLAQATAHRVAWLRMCYGWQRIDRLAALRGPMPDAAMQSPPPASPRHRTPPRRWLAAAAVLLLTLGATTYLGVTLLHDAPRQYTTALGGQQTVPLKDGSRVELNTDTRIRASVDEEARRVWIEHGEAYFDIKRDPSRPFVVEAGGHRVVVLGTRFSVRRERDRVEVTVEDGRVRVEEVTKDSTPPKVAVATRGEKVLAVAGSLMLAASEPEKISRELAWRNGVLVFDRMTLPAAADEFNRYNERKLEVTRDVPAGILISGSFDATNVEAFTRLLQKAYGLRVADRGDAMVVSN